MSDNVLGFILSNQEAFQKRFGYSKDMSEKEKIELIHTHSNFLIEETIEMLRELPYHKPWVDYSGLTNEQIVEKKKKAAEEFIDVLIFLSNTAIFLDLSEKDILKLYLEKSNINHKRQEDPQFGYIQ